MAREPWQDFLANNIGKVSGIAVALILGWMILEYGLFKTLFVMVLVVIGYAVGKQADDGEDIRDWVNRIFKR